MMELSSFSAVTPTMVPESCLCQFSAGLGFANTSHWLAYCEIGAQYTKRWIVSAKGLVVKRSQENGLRF